MPSHYSPISRILVALDASASSISALQAAVELAVRFEAEVIGLFVEDINLLRLAQLPFAREVSFFSSELRPLRTLELETQLRAQAERARRILAAEARRRGVPWHFRIARGSVTAEILSAGAEADLLIMGKIGRSLPGFQRSGSTVRMLLSQRRGLTLVLQSTVIFTKPVILLQDGSEPASRALDTALFLVRAHNSRLIIMIVARDLQDAARQEQEIGLHLRGQGVRAQLRILINPPAASLIRLIRMEGDGPVVLPCEKDFFQGEQLCAMVDEIMNPVLLVR